MAPVSVDALALKATVLPRVALRRSPAPALATVWLKLTVAVDGSAKIRSPAKLVMLKLSKVATAPTASVSAIALPAAATVPPPVARIDGEVPLNAKALDEACDVVTFSAPEAVTEPDKASTPTDRGPETAIEVEPCAEMAPPAAANNPASPAPLSAMVVGPLSVAALPESLTSTPPPVPPLTTTPSVSAVEIAPP